MTWLVIFLVLISPILAAFIVEVAHRAATSQALLNNPAKCDHCHKEITTVDLVPIVGWLIQLGKCRHCGKNISLSYSLGEVTVIIVAILPILFDLPLVIYLIAVPLGWALVILAIVDVLGGKRIREYCLPLILCGWIFTWLQQPSQLLRHILAAVLAFLFFWLVNKLWQRFRDRNAGADGDFYFAAMIGAWIGVDALTATLLLGLFFSAFAGMAQLIYVKVTKSERPSSGPVQTPLVPGLASAFFLMWLMMQSNLQELAALVAN